MIVFMRFFNLHPGKALATTMLMKLYFVLLIFSIGTTAFCSDAPVLTALGNFKASLDAKLLSIDSYKKNPSLRVEHTRILHNAIQTFSNPNEDIQQDKLAKLSAIKSLAALPNYVLEQNEDTLELMRSSYPEVVEKLIPLLLRAQENRKLSNLVTENTAIRLDLEKWCNPSNPNAEMTEFYQALATLKNRAKENNELLTYLNSKYIQQYLALKTEFQIKFDEIFKRKNSAEKSGAKKALNAMIEHDYNPITLIETPIVDRTYLSKRSIEPTKTERSIISISDDESRFVSETTIQYFKKKNAQFEQMKTAGIPTEIKKFADLNSPSFQQIFKEGSKQELNDFGHQYLEHSIMPIEGEYVQSIDVTRLGELDQIVERLNALDMERPENRHVEISMFLNRFYAKDPDQTSIENIKNSLLKDESETQIKLLKMGTAATRFESCHAEIAKIDNSLIESLKKTTPSTIDLSTFASSYQTIELSTQKSIQDSNNSAGENIK